MEEPEHHAIAYASYAEGRDQGTQSGWEAGLEDAIRLLETRREGLIDAAWRACLKEQIEALRVLLDRGRAHDAG